MKNLIFGFGLILILFSCNQVNKNNAKEIEKDLKRKFTELGIQYSKIIEYEYKFGKLDEKSAFLVELSEFDRKGNVIRTETYNRSEYLKEYDQIEFFTYDTSGNIINTIVKDTVGNIKSIIKNKYENALNTERLFYDTDEKLKSKVLYKFDNNENATELISYNETGAIEYKTIYKFNSNNEEIEENRYDKNGDKESSSKIIEINKKKRECQIYNAKGELEYKYIYLINDNNRITESTDVDVKTNKTSKTLYKYIDNYLLVEIISYGNNGEPELLKKIEYIKFSK